MNVLRFTFLALVPGAAAFAQNNGAAQPAVSTADVVIAVPGNPGPEIPTIPVVTTPGAASGETTVTLGIANGIRYVPPSHLSVAAGERLTIVSPFGPDMISTTSTIAWVKNGKRLEGVTSSSLVIERVGSDDAGNYTCQLSTPSPLAAPLYSQALQLGVGPTSRLLNVSTRGKLAAGAGENLVTGFVVAGLPGASKKIILRAIGPTLARFGVEHPLAKPVLRVYDSAGKPYDNAYGYVAMVGALTYEKDLADSLNAVGAFPTPPDSADVVLLKPFAPGAYTVQVTSGDGSAGEVLVEIYEVP